MRSRRATAISGMYEYLPIVYCVTLCFGRLPRLFEVRQTDRSRTGSTPHARMFSFRTTPVSRLSRRISGCASLRDSGSGLGPRADTSRLLSQATSRC